MKRKTALIVFVLLICCLNTPLSVCAAAYSAADGQPAASMELAGKKRHVKKKHKNDIDALVKEHVISKETGEKVKAYLKTHSEERKAEREKVGKMTAEERRAYFKEKYPNGRPDMWTDMTAAGVITADEAIAIKAALHAKHEDAYKKK